MEQLSSAGRDCCFLGGVLCKKRNRVVPGATLTVSNLSDLGDILELKEDRKIRVLHLQGSSCPPSKEDIQREEEEDAGDSGGYWFENAFPSRGRLPLPLFTLTPPKAPHRIFNKFEPQEPRKIPEVNNTPMLPVSSNRLTRKTIMTDELYDDDDDECLGEEPPKSEMLIEALSDNSQVLLQITADTTSAHKAQETHSQKSKEDVIVIPDPGESSTDAAQPGEDGSQEGQSDSEGSNDSLVFENSCLGGNANVAFDADEDLSVKSPSESTEPQAPLTVIPDVVPVNERPLLFFIHGIGGSASIWKSQLQYFSHLGFEVLAPDLLGHGFSSTPDNAKAYSFRKLLCDLLKIFDHYVYPRRKAVIVGHGYGCSFATAMSRMRNQNVIHIVLIGSGGPTPLSPPPVIPESFCCESLLKVFHCGRRKQRTRYRKSLKFPKSLDVPKYVYNHMIGGQSWPEGDVTFHRKINIPTLLVYGLKDPYVSLVEMCEMERTITKSYLELLPLSGHYLMIDQGKELNTMIRKFMEKYENHYHG